MKEIGAYEVKTHLSELLDEVAKSGEAILVTKRGKPIAKIVPYQNGEKSLDDIAEEFQRLRQSLSSVGPSIQEMIEEGRRF